ncbi:tRNA (guanine(37)-N1)-methyltransferase [Agrilus planipennis]|uniref:tRNA (guanine(37)-N1)-methyltransferase n=1 Tax=Agrilus planipennis TaxID=224129 RepID=A0A1W4X5K3_AGRPL|nr:tRNA (guanine(37)-N1)-methyltransferase [Agrilus planipennis]
MISNNLKKSLNFKNIFRMFNSIRNVFFSCAVGSAIKKLIQKELYHKNMSKFSNLNPPDHVRGMTILDKSKFNKMINVPVIKIRGLKVSDVLPFLKNYLLKLEKFQPVTTTNNSEVHVLLNPEIIKGWLDILLEDRESLELINVKEENLDFHMFTLTYENFSANTILKAVLPVDKEGLSSFSKIGHIVHINLREHLLPYKSFIGQVLYDKVPNMEVLCGYNEMMVKVKENKCFFEFDFSFVYWNPRLCTEHERIINLLHENDVLFDIFAGVGPFAIPAAKKKCIVYANDLNPESYKWLNHNASLNKIRSKNLQTFSKDGRDFILTDLKTNLKKYIVKNETNKDETCSVHITMNLPALAVQFVKNFYGLYTPEELNKLATVPMVHVYCFTKGENPHQIARSILQNSMDCDISDCIVDVFKVRTVSSMKEMMRVSFRIERDILTGQRPRLIKRRIDNITLITPEVPVKKVAVCHEEEIEAKEYSLQCPEKKQQTQN